MSKFIELKRRFHKIIESNKDQEKTAINSYTQIYFGSDNAYTWEEIYQQSLVVILGEPGSGKTAELKNRYELLLKANKFSFIIRLEELTYQSFLSTLSDEFKLLYYKWLKSDEEAIFFLDSVDEAKITSSAKFYSALDRFRDAIIKNQKNVKIIISSRISEWLPIQDKEEIEARFVFALQTKRSKFQDNLIPDNNIFNSETSRNKLLVLQIEPLNIHQVAEFVRNNDVEKPKIFMDAIESEHAIEFIRRPIDVIAFIEYWKNFGKLGSITELIEYSVQKKLQYTRDTDELTMKMARDGAETLAAATILCQQYTFRVPDEVSVTDSIDGFECLPPSWSKNQFKLLINRPVFDDASYGKIRFHHRRISEYLASQWFVRLIDEGDMPLFRLENILFHFDNNKRVLRETMVPIAAWLCNGSKKWNEYIRNWILESTPELFMKYGDPSILSVEYKQRLLETLIDKYKSRKNVWIDTEVESLARLGHTEMGPYIQKIIIDRRVSVDIRCLMVRLVRYGRLVRCLPTLNHLIISTNEPVQLKSSAAATLRDIGDEESLKQLAENVKQMHHLPNDVCAHICEALFPSTITDEELVNIIKKSDSVQEFSIGLNYNLNYHIKHKLHPASCLNTLNVFIELVQTPPCIIVNDKKTTISEKYWWVGELILTLIEKLLSNDKLSPVEVDSVARGLFLVRYILRYTHIHIDDKNKINILISHHPNVRQKYFWLSVEKIRLKGMGEPYGLYQIYNFDGLIGPNTTDLEWLIADIGHRSEYEDRFLALRMSALLLPGNFTRIINTKILKAINGDASILTEYKKIRRHLLFLPIKLFWINEIINKFGNSRWWEFKRRTINTLKDNLLIQLYLYGHLRRLIKGEDIYWLGQLVREADNNKSSKWIPDNWDGLKAKRGSIIVWAAKQGCKKVWRKNVPLLPHELQNRNQIPTYLILGMVGIQEEINSGLINIQHLSAIEANRIARYGLYELNEYPSWLYSVAEYSPDSVGNVFNECIRAEWQFAENEENIYGVIHKLVWQGRNLSKLVEDEIVRLLRESEPTHLSILRAAMSILLSSAELRKNDLISVCEEKLAKHTVDDNRSIFWLSILLKLNASRGIHHLELALQGNKDPDALMVGLCGNLYNHPYDEKKTIENPDYTKPEHLGKLLHLIFKHVKPIEDITHTGSYTPGARDEAQHFRSILFEKLVNSVNDKVDDIFRGFLNDSVFTEIKDYIYHVLELREIKRADLIKWNPLDVKNFEYEHEIEPKTGNDLFQIVLWRLHDIKHDIEKADTSIRREMHPNDKETILRIWLTNKFEQRARNKYTVPQEEEVDNEKRPDIRIENAKVRGPISIEIKWAHKWSYEELLKGLKKQLIEQYLKDENAEYGIYILGIIGKGKKWRTAGKILSFPELVNNLQIQANRLIVKRGDIRRIMVEGLDFRIPSKPHKKLRKN